MTVAQPLESTLIGVGDNYIIMDGVDTYLDVDFTVYGTETRNFSFRYTANENKVNINLREITRLVYDNVENYSDPFDYSADVLYTETDGYHFIKLDIDMEDAASDTHSISGIKVINAALDTGECLLLASLEDEILNEQAGKAPSNFISLNYDLNFSLH